MISATLLVDLPEGAWIGEVSRAFPRATFRLLAGTRTGEGATELGEVRATGGGGLDVEAVEAAIAGHPAVVDYERLDADADGDRLLARYGTTETGLYAFIEGASVPLEFPVDVRDGRYQLRLTGTREEFDRVRATLDANDHGYELLAKTGGGGADDEPLLTARQREVLAAALRAGYLDVPRECTLAELAADLGADKSTVSGVLRRGQARLAAWYLTGRTDRGR